MIRYNIVVMLMISVLLAGCASVLKTNVESGKIRESDDVTSSYKSYTINPDYNYYFYGSELQPDAVMGIDKRYVVKSSLWKQIDLTREQLEYWVIWGDRERTGESYSKRYGGYQGAYVLDPQDAVIGDWYSKKDMGIFDFPGNNVMIPYPPMNQGGSSNKPCDSDW